LLALLCCAVVPSLAEAKPSSAVLTLQLVPAIENVVVTADGNVARSNAKGVVRLPVDNFTGLDKRVEIRDQQVEDGLRVSFDRTAGDYDSGVNGDRVQVGLITSRPVSWAFQAKGEPVAPTDVTSLTIRNSIGEQRTYQGAALVKSHWVQASRTQRYTTGLVSKDLVYSVSEVLVDGSNVVSGGLNTFEPTRSQFWTIQLLYYDNPFTSGDLLFGGVVGQGVLLTLPDQTEMKIPFDDNGVADPGPLPRGAYEVKVYGSGISFTSPISLSRDQADPVVLRVISPLDIVVVVGSVMLLAVGLVLLGRPPKRWRRRGRSELALPLVAAATVLTLVGLVAAPAPDARAAEPPRRDTLSTPAEQPIPVLAYYYIWFNTTSWDRAKIDYPLLGRYSSADPVIMRQHIEMAKSVGIDGFLVSWKNTPELNARLETLTRVARKENFHLGIVYQGLDFARQPLPNAQVRLDLQLFADDYADDPVYKIFRQPVVIWTGSYLQSPSDIARVVAPVADKLLVLGSAKTVEEYRASADILDGNAYYWSSVDPTMQGYQQKLIDMGEAVHRAGDLWIAPLSPGFDARLVGGTREIPRDGGQTLRTEYNAAIVSEPDALGVISWNEFSENSHIEPSERFGDQSLRTLGDILGTRPPQGVPVDSSSSFERPGGMTSFGALTVMLLGLAVLSIVAALVRRRRLAPRDQLPSDGGGGS
jgi:hypothetical protein